MAVLPFCVKESMKCCPFREDEFKVEGSKLIVGSLRLEVRSEKLGVGSWKSDDRRRKTETWSQSCFTLLCQRIDEVLPLQGLGVERTERQKHEESLKAKEAVNLFFHPELVEGSAKRIQPYELDQK